MNGIELLDDCDKDDVISFKTNGSLTISFNTLCSSGDDATTDGTWALTQNDSRHRIVIDQDESIYEITELTSTSLKLTISETVDGTTFTLVNTFKAQ